MDDPSEYEGTVQRQEGALSAGVLEKLLEKAPEEPKFQYIDFGKEVGDLYISIFSLQESLSKVEESSIGAIVVGLEEQVVKISIMKEDYLGRRKVLSSCVRKFTADFLTPSEDTQSADAMSLLQSECRQLIDKFKADFDYLSSLSRYSEASVLSVCKALKEAFDPSATISEGLQVCLRAQDALKRAQEQLNIASKLLSSQHSSTASSSSSSSTSGITSSLGTSGHDTHSSADMAAIRREFEEKQKELEQQNLNEIANLRTVSENEKRQLLGDLQASFDKQQLDQQKLFDDLLSKKEAELASLLRSLQENQQRVLESDERGRLLEVEVAKRRDLEDRLRTALVQAADLSTELQEMKQQMDKSVGSFALTEEKLVSQIADLNRAIASIKDDDALMRAKLAIAEKELASRPPANLSMLMDKIGLDFEGEHTLTVENDGEVGVSEKSKFVNWNDVEKYLVENFRRCNNEATRSRLTAIDATKSAESLQKECEHLRSQLTDKLELTAALEKDLLFAHQALHAGKKPSRTMPVPGESGYVKKKSNIDYYSTANKSDLLAGRGLAVSGEDLENVLSLTPNSKERVSHPTSLDDSMEVDLNFDIHTLLSSSSPVKESNPESNNILQAVQQQRDRFMKSVMAKEQEITELRGNLDRLEEEILQLRNENLEIYRRLRILRVNSSSKTSFQSNENLEDGGDGSVAYHTSRLRSKKERSEFPSDQGRLSSHPDVNGQGSDPLEEKYLNLYEQKLSPFQLEQIDKHAFLHRLNVFERMLAFVMKSISQDKWARHALMVYLVLVHIFALMYVLQVLNPQLIDEVDAHLKAKWSKEAMGMPEHPDIE